MNNKQLIIGLGTGRCGTVSLSRLFSNQSNSFVSHERSRLPWNVDAAKYNTVFKNIHSTEHQYIGDVSFYNLPYVDSIICDYPNVKFVVLRRNLTDTVKSYLKKTTGRNHWQQHGGKGFRLCPWDQCYPKFEASSKQHALEQYWNLYYDTCEKIDQSKCFWLNTNDLNNESKCKEMLAFCGFDDPVYNKIQLNKT